MCDRGHGERMRARNGCALANIFACAILAYVQATDTSTQVTAQDLAGELLALWHFLMKGQSKKMFAILDELDLSMSHVKALGVLADCGCELSVKEVSEELGLSLPGGSRTVDSLMRRGYLERREDDADRRMKRIGITDAGRDVARRVLEARLEGLEQFTSSLTDEQRARLMTALSDLPHRS
jgi:DNA-binding MarR family transcriptional regulator